MIFDSWRALCPYPKSSLHLEWSLFLERSLCVERSLPLERSVFPEWILSIEQSLCLDRFLSLEQSLSLEQFLGFEYSLGREYGSCFLCCDSRWWCDRSYDSSLDSFGGTARGILAVCDCLASPEKSIIISSRTGLFRPRLMQPFTRRYLALSILMFVLGKLPTIIGWLERPLWVRSSDGSSEDVSCFH